jgi:hypothetical protein
VIPMVSGLKAAFEKSFMRSAPVAVQADGR